MPSQLRQFLAVAWTAALTQPVAAQSVAPRSDPALLPEVEVRAVRRVFHDGHHDAFTDLCRFQGRYYLAFRSCPDGHGVHPTSSIVVLASGDTREWTEVHRFAVRWRDVRDPHFLVFSGKLFVYTGTWHCGETSPRQRDINDHLGYAASTADGKAWNGPVMLEGTYGHYVWRAASHGGKVYLCARRKRGFRELASRADRFPLLEAVMMESDDGLIFRRRAFFTTEHGDETAFLFEPDGSVVAVARRGRLNAFLCRSKPPWSEWQRTDLGRYIGGPLLARWGARYVVGGRNGADGKYTTVLCWLRDGKLVDFARLPSGGDNSYPGFVAEDDRRALVSYYSSHERDPAGKPITAIYLAELAVR